MAGVKVGEDAMLGAMGVATHDVPPHSIWGGVPAREIKARSKAGSHQRRRLQTYLAVADVLPSGFRWELLISFWAFLNLWCCCSRSVFTSRRMDGWRRGWVTKPPHAGPHYAEPHQAYRSGRHHHAAAGGLGHPHPVDRLGQTNAGQYAATSKTTSATTFLRPWPGRSAMSSDRWSRCWS